MALHIIHYIREVRTELGGVVSSVLTLCRNLAARGHRVSLLTCDTQDVPPCWMQNNPNTPEVLAIELPRRPWGNTLAASQKILSELSETADLMHFHTLWDPANLHLARFAKSKKIPYVVSLHGMLDDYAFSQKRLKKSAFITLIGKRFLQLAAAVHCTAEGERRQVLEKIPLEQLFVIPHYFDWDLFRSLPGPNLALKRFPILNTDEPKILSLSRLVPLKGADLLIEAAAKLLQEGTDLRLVLAGPNEGNYQATLQKLSDSLGIRHHVHFLGLVRGQEKVSLYQACNLFALPTMQENFGIVLVEAMAAELPTITTPYVDIALELEAAGARIVDRSTASFATAMQEVLKAKSTGFQNSTKSRQAIFQWLDPKTISDKYEQMYLHCLKKVPNSTNEVTD